MSQMLQTQRSIGNVWTSGVPKRNYALSDRDMTEKHMRCQRPKVSDTHVFQCNVTIPENRNHKTKQNVHQELHIIIFYTRQLQYVCDMNFASNYLTRLKLTT